MTSSEYSKSQYLKHKEKIRARMKITRSSPEYKAKATQRRRKKSDFVKRYKLAARCYDCGYAKASEALQFDHVQGIKKGIIGQFLDKSWKSLLSEITKCQVRCANCHAIKTKAEQYP